MRAPLSVNHRTARFRLLQFAQVVVLCCMPAAVGAAEMAPEQRAFFESKIRPVLARQCYECHAANAKKIGGKLLLDTPAEMLGGGESGPAVIPGKPDESLIVQALRYDGLEMPPKHRLPESVVNDFATWVKMGAPDPRENAKSAAKKAPVADEAALWAFRPMATPGVPEVRSKTWPRSEIDAFILANVEARNLAPASDASPAALIRRLSIDLTGLPPALEEVAAFEKEAAQAGSLERLVDRLLASPHFGERWGRHWLDVARYAESNGNDGLSRNASFPHAWRYRDYVIRAFNDDTPYDRFITEQIAGDLLPADTAEQRDRQRIATGFLALGAKPAKAMNDNFEMDVVADQINVIGRGIMGLSVGCARCHDHKTDPIPTRDYYALAGIFKSTETLWGAAAREALTAPQTALYELETAPKIPPHPALEPVLSTYKSRKAPAKAAFAYAPDAALAMGVREAKVTADCKLNIDGDSKKLGAAIPRGFLTASSASGPAAAIEPTQSGRLQLAQWLASPEHPQTARVMVNRVWQHLFGEGLVRTPDDFGVYGERPTHPDLLDWLATRFTADGWSVKRLIRAIVLSRTYQLSSTAPEALRAADPANTLLARHQRRRLDAESFRDAILAASGELDPEPPTGSLIQQRDLLINELGHLHQPSTHRSVYLLMLRNSMPPELTPFNLPDATTVTGKRDETTLATQALYLLNNRFLVEQAQRLATRLLASCDGEPGLIREAYRRVLTRDPEAREMERATAFLREFEVASPEPGAAWAAFCHALFARRDLTANCNTTDAPIAALLEDLEERGLLDETLVVWGGEFGRPGLTPGDNKDQTGHNARAFTFWLAGGGVKAGHLHGRTDETGANGVEGKVHFRDLHATILHLLGLDANELAVVSGGRRIRLTGVQGGMVVKEILA
jgi:hypothetical protein